MVLDARNKSSLILNNYFMSYKVLDNGDIEETGAVRILTSDMADAEIKNCQDSIVSMQSEINRLQSKIDELTLISAAAKTKKKIL